MPPTILSPTELVEASDPDAVHKQALAQVHAEFRPFCPRHKDDGELTGNAHLASLQWGLLNDPSKVISFYSQIGRSKKEACGNDDSPACLARFRALAHDMHRTYMPQVSFMEWNVARRRVLWAAFAADPKVPGLVAGFKRSSAEKRLETLGYFAEMIRAAYSDGEVVLDMPTLRAIGDGKKRRSKYVTIAEYRPGENALVFDKWHLMAGEFMFNFGNLQHEMTHLIQFQLAMKYGWDGATQLKARGIEHDSLISLINMGSLYARQDGTKAGYEIYQLNPVETVARFNEEDVRMLRIVKGRVVRTVAETLDRELQAYRDLVVKHRRGIESVCEP